MACALSRLLAAHLWERRLLAHCPSALDCSLCVSIASNATDAARRGSRSLIILPFTPRRRQSYSHTSHKHKITLVMMRTRSAILICEQRLQYNGTWISYFQKQTFYISWMNSYMPSGHPQKLIYVFCIIFLVQFSLTCKVGYSGKFLKIIIIIDYVQWISSIM